MIKRIPAAPHVFVQSSVFLTSTLIVAFCTAIVSASLTFSSFNSARNLTDDSVRLRALEVTQLIAQQVGGALKFSKGDVIEAVFSGVISLSQGAAKSAVAISADGTVLTSQDVIPANMEMMAALADNATVDGRTKLSSDGYLVAVPVRFGNKNKTIGAIVIRWSSDRMQAQLLEELYSSLLITGALFFGVMLAAAFFLRRHVSSPLVGLRDAMEQVAGSNYTVEIPGLSRRDEIGGIAKTLETFRNALEAAAQTTRDSLFKGAAFEGSTAAMMMIDDESKIRYLNAECRELLGKYVHFWISLGTDFDVDSLVGRPIRCILDHQQLPDETTAVQEHVPYQTDICIGDKRVNLTVNSVSDADGIQIGRVLEWKDVTEERLNKAVLDTIDSNQIHVEFLFDGTLASSNESFANVLGLSPDDLMGVNLVQLFKVYEKENAHSEIGMSILAKRGQLLGRFVVKLDNGKQRFFEGGFTRVEDSSGRALRIVFIGNDITKSLTEIEALETKRSTMQIAQTRVVTALSLALGDLALGDLTGQIEDEFPEEYEGLRADFNEALKQLWAAMRTVVESAEIIGNEAKDISAAAEGLSQRTESQAARLEETAASVDELTSSVKTAAKGANQASQVAAEATTSAANSESIVGETVSAMGEIQESSAEIGKIIKVIEDIAFQTNLLALNAGVEAARAGDSGRGFAVVASEVRALAQRSTEAAQEINALISKSGGQVQRGVNLVDQMGCALGDMVASVAEISIQVTGIADTVQEQSGSLEEINASMSHLDRETQQNAAMFEETTAASHALTNEARSLGVLTSKFKVEDQGLAQFSDTDNMQRRANSA